MAQETSYRDQEGALGPQEKGKGNAPEGKSGREKALDCSREGGSQVRIVLLLYSFYRGGHQDERSDSPEVSQL